MNKKRVLPSVIALWLAIMSCNLPGVQPPTESPAGLSPEQLSGTATALAITATFTVTPEITATVPVSPTACSATIVANTNINVRSGPGTVYSTVGSIPSGGNAAIAGKNAEGTWWYINFAGGAGGHAWVGASVTTATCVPTTLSVIAAPPTPRPASGTCKDDYVYRLINSSDKVCVPPASKTQADADNAAASSRLITSTYGPDTCVDGYVWREAYSGDKVCVTDAVRNQAAADNAAAASRWVVGAYGPHTCIAGFVWREASGGDDVCVTADVRSQAASDNAAAASRKAVNVYGADACASGYVWREAFSGDHVCVTPAVRNQVAADNAAAPSHTWP